MAYRWTAYTRIKCSECKQTREALASKATTAALMGKPFVCRFCAPVGRVTGENRGISARKQKTRQSKLETRLTRRRAKYNQEVP